VNIGATPSRTERAPAGRARNANAVHEGTAVKTVSKSSPFPYAGLNQFRFDGCVLRLRGISASHPERTPTSCDGGRDGASGREEALTCPDRADP